MEFKDYLADQIRRHPSAQPQDLVKACYQAAFGAEHLLGDLMAAKTYLEREYASVDAEAVPLYESLSEDVCRISLPGWKARNLPTEWLFRMFADTASVCHEGKVRFADYLTAAQTVVRENQVSFSYEEWKQYLREYEKAGMPAVHHSRRYRDREKPAYRIVSGKYVRILPILEKIAKLDGRGKPLVVVIDGPAASGKSTMAVLLKTVLEAEIVRMDDFFLPPALRTAERFASPGGNVHYERFAQEVLPYIGKDEPFSYRVFDCGRMDYRGVREIGAAPIRIVEGSYSSHPGFGRYGDLTVFSTVSHEEQVERIRRRNGEAMLTMFQERWIPMEERYFSHFRIMEQADLCL